MNGSERIAAERLRQIEQEYWTSEHDDHHDRGELALAAASYAYAAVVQNNSGAPSNTPPLQQWPWKNTDDDGNKHYDGWKPSPDPIRNLEKAGALIAAEIDRLLRKDGVK